MYIRNENTDSKVYQTYISRYTAMCILKGSKNMSEIYTRQKFFEMYNEYFRKHHTVVNAMYYIVQSHVIKSKKNS